MNPSLHTKLYDKARCLHLPNYELSALSVVCGACFFREGVLDEVPTRASIKEASGLFGAPQYNPQLMAHLMVEIGLVPPAPDEPLSQFRKRRQRQSWKSKQFPFTNALWDLMGVQPPLARVFVEFCKGYSEFEVAESQQLSLYNVVGRMTKAVHVSKKFLRIDYGAIS